MVYPSEAGIHVLALILSGARRMQMADEPNQPTEPTASELDSLRDMAAKLRLMWDATEQGDAYDRMTDLEAALVRWETSIGG